MVVRSALVGAAAFSQRSSRSTKPPDQSQQRTQLSSPTAPNVRLNSEGFYRRHNRLERKHEYTRDVNGTEDVSAGDEHVLESKATERTWMSGGDPDDHIPPPIRSMGV